MLYYFDHLNRCRGDDRSKGSRNGYRGESRFVKNLLYFSATGHLWFDEIHFQMTLTAVLS